MTQEKQRYPAEQAREVAEVLMGALRESCEYIEIAGSIRRGLPTVGDIELLCVSKLGAISTTPKPPEHQAAFAWQDEGSAPDNRYNPKIVVLEGTIQGLIDDGRLAKRPNKDGRFTYGAKNKLLVHIESGIPVDIFTADEANWGMALVVRTGSANFNKKLMKAFMNKGMEGHAYGGVTVPGRGEVNCPTEESVFALLGWDFIEPADRK